MDILDFLNSETVNLCSIKDKQGKTKKIWIKSNLKGWNCFFTVHSKVRNDTIGIHKFKMLVALLIAFASKGYFRLIIDNTPVKHFKLHSMSHIDKLTSHVFGRDGNCNTWESLLFGDALFSHVFVFVVVQVTQRNIGTYLVKFFYAFLVKGLNYDGEVFLLAFLFTV